MGSRFLEPGGQSVYLVEWEYYPRIGISDRIERNVTRRQWNGDIDRPKRRLVDRCFAGP